MDGRWIGRDIELKDYSPYIFIANRFYSFDILGKFWQQNQPNLVSAEDLVSFISDMDLSDTPWIEKALKEHGVSECNKEKMSEYASCLPQVVNQWIRDKMSTGEGAWCACFVYFCTGGFKTWKPKDPFCTVRAKEYCNVWKQSSHPVFGAIVVLTTKGGCHVSFVVGEDSKNVYVLGGNQDNAVRISAYAKDRVIGYRFPEGIRSTPPITVHSSGDTKPASTR